MMIGKVEKYINEKIDVDGAVLSVVRKLRGGSR